MTHTRFQGITSEAVEARENGVSAAEARYAALRQAAECISGADRSLQEGSAAGADEALALLREAAAKLNAALGR